MSETINGNYFEDARSLDTTVVIDQATGMLSVQLDVPIAEALEWMRSKAFVQGQFLAEFAENVVARRVTFGAGDREA